MAAAIEMEAGEAQSPTLPRVRLRARFFLVAAGACVALAIGAVLVIALLALLAVLALGIGAFVAVLAVIVTVAAVVGLALTAIIAAAAGLVALALAVPALGCAAIVATLDTMHRLLARARALSAEKRASSEPSSPAVVILTSSGRLNAPA